VDDVERRLRAGGGAIDRRSHPDLTGAIDRRLRTGELVALLPGIYCSSVATARTDVRLRAAALWAGPDAVFTGLTAARLTFWPDCPLATITLALPTMTKVSRPGFITERRHVPPTELVDLDGLRATQPSLTAVDLACTPAGGEAIDRALRSRTATLEQMWSALARHPNRPGNPQRRALLLDSADQPWSEAERVLHRLLRQSGLTGWSTNVWVTATGNRYCVDVLFAATALIVEVDGWEVHGSRSAFEDDRRRRNHLVLEGYRVLNLTWRQLVDDPDWVVACVRAALFR
jgi:very-short-patch-repair endonuclease